MDSRLDYRLNRSPSGSSPAKESYKLNDRVAAGTLGYSAAEMPFLPSSASLKHHTLNKRGRDDGSGSSDRLSLAKRRLSWRCVAICFIVLAVGLSAALASVAASAFLPASSPPPAPDRAYSDAKACAIVVDDNDAPNSPSSPSSNSLSGSNPPPDGTAFKQISLDEAHAREIAPYGYWNVQFYRPSPGYVELRLRLPRGASLGVYARRNALPTHTNYDAMEVVRGVEDAADRPKREVSSPRRDCSGAIHHEIPDRVAPLPYLKAERHFPRGVERNSLSDIEMARLTGLSLPC